MTKRQDPTRRKLPTILANAIWDHPGYEALPAAGRGMLWTLVEHWWKTDCRPRPTLNDRLFSVMRAHRPTFQAHCAEILLIFDEVAPIIERDMRQRQATKERIKEFGKKAGFKRSAEAAQARIEKSFPSRTAASAPLLPVKDKTPEPPPPRTITPKPHDTKPTRGGTFRDRPR